MPSQFCSAVLSDCLDFRNHTDCKCSCGWLVGRHNAVFTYHPLVFAATILVSVLTSVDFCMATSRRLSKLTPLEAI